MLVVVDVVTPSIEKSPCSRGRRVFGNALDLAFGGLSIVFVDVNEIFCYPFPSQPVVLVATLGAEKVWSEMVVTADGIVKSIADGTGNE